MLLGLPAGGSSDTPLARLIAAHAQQMSEAELTDVVRECASGLVPLPAQRSPIDYPILEGRSSIVRQLLDLGYVVEQRGDLPEARDIYQKTREVCDQDPRQGG